MMLHMKRFVPLSLLGIAATLTVVLLIRPDAAPAADHAEISGEETEKMTKRERIDGWMQWRHERLLNDDGEVSPVDRYRALAQADQIAERQQYAKSGLLDLDWELVGPDNMGGRTRAIAFDPDVPGRMWAGTVSGGLYTSDNSGRDWQPVESYDGIAPIGDMDVGADGAIYVATGEGFTANGSRFNSGHWGDGVWKSADKGSTWTHLESTIANSELTLTDTDEWSAVNRIAAHPSDPNIVIAATANGGIYYSSSGGEGPTGFERATRITGTPMAGEGESVQWNADGSIAFAALSGSIYRSTDNGETWEGPLSGLATAQRAEIATAPSNSDVVYVSLSRNPAAGETGNGCMRGVYRSKDGGLTWEIIIDDNDPLDPDIFADGDGFGTYCQGWFDQCIAVNPVNEDQIYMGGISFFAWEPGIGGVKLADNRGAGELNEDYIHSDKHRIVFDPHDPTGNTMWVGHDGGLSLSQNASSGFPGNMAYVERNKNYISLQPYGIGAGKYGDILAGSQDQGTTYIDGSGITDQACFSVFGNDGIYAEVSHLEPEVLYLGWQNGNLLLSANGGSSTVSALGGAIDQGSCGVPSGCSPSSTPNCEANYAAFIPPFFLFEPTDTNQRDRAKLFFATNCGVWVLLNPLDVQDPPIWQRINTVSSVSAFDMSVDGDILYFARGNSVYVTSGFNSATLTDSTGSRTTSNISGLVTNQRNVASPIEGIAVDINDPDHVVVTTAGYSSSSHVYKTTNATTSLIFNSIHDVSGAPGQTLPTMPIYDVEIDYSNPDNYILGTELGIWTSNDGGVTWTEDNDGGLGRVPVVRLRQETINPEINAPDQCYVLYAGAHGLGTWRSTDRALGGCDTEPFKNMTSIREVNRDVRELALFPNPVSNVVNVDFDLAASTDVRIDVLDMTGRVVMSQSIGARTAGDHRVQLNVGSLSTGNYFLNLYTDERAPASKLMVKR